jgi:prevent-host-death family protein
MAPSGQFAHLLESRGVVFSKANEMSGMKMRISSKELIRNFGAFSDIALKEPVVITKNGRDRLVLLSIEDYQTLQGPTSDDDGADLDDVAGESRPAE